jgi:outer membrane lipoprotein-sorting protein
MIQLKMKGEKYLLNEGKLEILCDGTSIFNFDGVNTISKSSLAETEQTLSPQKLLSGNYDKDFNFKLLAQNNNTATIELFPIDRKKSFQKVTLVIDKVKSALANAIILDKSNNITDVKVLSINYAASFEDKLFVFNRAKYPKNVEIFD